MIREEFTNTLHNSCVRGSVSFTQPIKKKYTPTRLCLVAIAHFEEAIKAAINFVMMFVDID